MSATELLKNNRLGSVGADGVSFVRTFLVQNPTDVEGGGVTVDARVDAQLRREAAPGVDSNQIIGIAGAVVQNYRTVETFGTTMAIVEVDYAAPTALNPGLGGTWHMRMFGYSDTEFTLTVPLTDAEKSNTKPRRGPNPGASPSDAKALIVGPFEYQRLDQVTSPPQPAPAGTQQIFKAGDIDLVVKGDSVKKWKRKPVGMDRFVPTGSIVYTKVFQNNNAGRLVSIMGKLSTVNRDSVSLPGFGTNVFPRGTLMLSDYEVEEVIGTVFGEAIIHRVGLTFAVRNEGWQYAVAHTYEDEETANKNATPVDYTDDQPILDGPSGGAVIEEFRRQFWTNYNGWMQGL